MIGKELKYYHWIAAVFLYLYTFVATSYVFMQLWQWFIADYYGAYHLSYSEAFMVVVFVNFAKTLLFGYRNEKFDMTLEQFKEGAYRSIVRPWVILFFAWVLKIIASIIW